MHVQALLSRSLKFSVVGLLLTTTGCTVYAPMQPTMPLLRQRGEAEFGASLQPLGRLELTGAYSPLAHVVVAGGLTGAPRLGERDFLATRQAELGAGLYQALGPHWLVGALGGGGLAYAHRGYVEVGIVGPSTYHEYTAHYSKLHGQLGVAYVNAGEPSASLTYRLVRVQFGELLDSQIGPLPLSATTRHELAFSARRSLGWPPASRWQLLGTVGVSLASTSPLAYDEPFRNYGSDYVRAAIQANNNLRAAFVASLGVGYVPGRRK